MDRCIHLSLTARHIRLLLKKTDLFFIMGISSIAARDLRGHAVNGWVYWRFQRRPGNWALLDELRKA
ncbi:MAG: hypothetical protein M1147_02100 [Nitrospirae bacterium]|nr:hypothetical protein [Nitrospirota bacterium]MCL5976904.1 hypothetical protein [Nitrospirota bacterium]